MSRRLAIELTSQRDDGTWTWRAVGARQPKGDLDGVILPDGASIGDELKVEVEDALDGIDVISVVQGRQRSRGFETLELLGSGGDSPGVTTQLQPKGKRRRGEGRGRGDKRGRGDGRRKGREGGGKGRGGGDRGRSERERPRRQAPDRPKPKRLKPKRTHRKAAVAEFAPELRPLADVLSRGGVPAVRTAVEQQNELNKVEGRAPVPAEPLVALAERLLPDIRTAEWHDRADAALAGIDEIDLRDLRSVVVAADNAAKTDETRALAEQIREGLTARVENEQRKWLSELAETLDEGRTVRALRMSSRPPKAGSPIPPDLTERLIAAASAGLTSEDSPDRWATVLDALAYSPVRGKVTPTGMPSSVSKELTSTLKKVRDRVPHIAEMFEAAKNT